MGREPAGGPSPCQPAGTLPRTSARGDDEERAPAAHQPPGLPQRHRGTRTAPGRETHRAAPNTRAHRRACPRLARPPCPEPFPPGSPAHYRCRAVPLPQSRLLLEAFRCPAGQGPRGEQCPPGWDRIRGEHFFLKAVRVLFLVTFYFRQVILVLLFKNYIFPNFKRN